MTQGVQRRMAAGAVWMLLFKAVERSLGLISTLILVRVLAPADFGIVAMAISFIAVAELLSSFGFDLALIQDPKATRAHFDTAWTFNAIAGATICVLMLAGAEPIAAFFREPAVAAVVMALALGPLITGLENIGVVAFRKELQFGRDFRFMLAKKLAGVAVTIPLALWLHSYWALVAGTLAGKLAGTAMSYWVSAYRPRFTFERGADLFGFSKWIVLQNLVNALASRSPDFMIGRMLGATSLGIYNVAQEFGSLPVTELASPVFRAVVPGFSKLQGDRPLLNQAYRRAIASMATVTLPAAFGVLAVSALMVPVVLGVKWMAVLPVLQAFTVYGAVFPLLLVMNALLLATGASRAVMLLTACNVAIFLSAMTLLLPRVGIVGGAWAVAASTLLVLPLYLWTIRRAYGIGAGQFVRGAGRPLLAATAMCAVVWPLADRAADALAGLPAVLALLGAVLLGALVYGALLLGLWAAAGRPDGPERMGLALLRERWNRWRAAR